MHWPHHIFKGPWFRIFSSVQENLEGDGEKKKKEKKKTSSFVVVGEVAMLFLGIFSFKRRLVKSKETLTESV